MTRPKVELISAGVEALLKSPEIRRELEARGEAIAAIARANAPRKTGAYADSIEVTVDETDRAAIRIGSAVKYATVVESRTGNLANALDEGLA